LKQNEPPPRFFNEEVTDYICNALGHTNATENKDDNDVMSITSLTASNFIDWERK